MRGRVLLALLSSSLVLVAPAAGHVTVAPPFLAVGEQAVLAFDAPNERDVAMTSLELEAPPEVRLVALEAPPAGWSGTLGERRARWSGGRLAPSATALYQVRARATGAPGSVTFRAVQHFEDGAVVRWETTLALVPGTGESAPRQHLRRAFLAAVAGLGVIATSLLLLHRVRRRPLQER
jgi:uncharacterized protein YcnI